MIRIVAVLPREREHRILEYDVEERPRTRPARRGQSCTSPGSHLDVAKADPPAERAIDDLESQANVGRSRHVGCPCAWIGSTSGWTERECQGDRQHPPSHRPDLLHWFRRQVVVFGARPLSGLTPIFSTLAQFKSILQPSSVRPSAKTGQVLTIRERVLEAICSGHGSRRD